MVRSSPHHLDALHHKPAAAWQYKWHQRPLCGRISRRAGIPADQQPSERAQAPYRTVLGEELDGGGPRRGVRLLTHSSQLKVPGPRYPHQNDYSSSCDFFGACTSGAVRCAEMPPQMCSAHAVEQQRRRGAEASGAGTAVARVHPQDGGRNRTRKEVSIHEW